VDKVCHEEEPSSNGKKNDLKKRSRRAGESGRRRPNVTVLQVSSGEDDVKLAARRALDELGESMDQPVQLVDLGRVESQVHLWRRFLPRVRPHYAVKCSPDRELIRTLGKGGCGFDCATMHEIDTVLSLKVPPEDIVYSHPCKPRTHIAYAKSKGVKLMSFDNACELRKVATEFPEAQLLLRLVCEDSSAQCPMSLKFGASKDSWAELLGLVVELGLDLRGVSFHVGSGCKDPQSFEKALSDTQEVFRMAASMGMDALSVLDIGGGLPGDKASFEQIAPIVGEKLDRLFSSADYPGLTIIAEPGRFFAHSSAHLVTKVYAKAKLPAADGTRDVCRYYLNDGLYGAFNCIIYDHVSVKPELLNENGRPEVPCAIFGPTCDGFDVVLEKHVLPELDEGDWVLWRNMGAYTVAAGSGFNGFPKAKPWYYRVAAYRFAEHSNVEINSAESC